MAEKRLSEIIMKFFEEMAVDVLEERVVQYIIRELKNGRKLQEILKDPYVTNRIPEERITDLLANKELIETLEKEIQKTFEKDLNVFD
ncbi:MAG: hypothetical protein N2440_02505 [Actinobacteria bacterium]|nr:hypothetical protein [Actinomycetota bacterium]